MQGHGGGFLGKDPLEGPGQELRGGGECKKRQRRKSNLCALRTIVHVGGKFCGSHCSVCVQEQGCCEWQKVPGTESEDRPCARSAFLCSPNSFWQCSTCMSANICQRFFVYVYPTGEIHKSIGICLSISRTLCLLARAFSPFLFSHHPSKHHSRFCTFHHTFPLTQRKQPNTRPSSSAR